MLSARMPRFFESASKTAARGGGEIDANLPKLGNQIIIKLFVRVKFATILNIFFDKEIIPEFIFEKFTDRNVLKKIDEAIQKVGGEQGYDFILDAMSGALLYALDSHNLTEDVMEELSKSTGSVTD